MYIQKISIDIPTTADKDTLVEEFGLLLSFYRGNGQTQGKIESQYIQDNKIVCLPFTLEKEALDKENNNFYVTRQIKKIEALCSSKLLFKTVGKSYDSYQGACTCKRPSYYLLITNYITIQSPITCGDCDQSVPLYRLPTYYDHGYMPLLNWETNYIACDSLQMNGEVGEQWALNQLQKHTSLLSKQGITLCKKIEIITSIPTFYYLHNYRKVEGDQSTRPCPSCKNQWNLKEPLQELYDFRCTPCRLISITSPNY